MNILSYGKLYLYTFAVTLAIDLPWILKIAQPFYKEQLGSLMTDSPKLLPGLLFYMLFAAALIFFVVLPALQAGSLKQALVVGFFFGLVVYSAYDLTNHATLKNWSLIMTVVDMLWGATLSCLVSGASFYGARWL